MIPEIVKNGNGILLPIDPSLDSVINAIYEMIRIKPTVMGYDLLNGKYTWKELGSQLFGLKSKF